ncbi:MAG: hypothetical protein R6U04_00145 [Bacteroidales bacterium]
MWKKDPGKIKPEKAKKKMGFYKDQKGIMNRYLREGEAWDTHLQNSREFIIQSSEGKDKNHVVVLGSGWLLDVPLKHLAENFKKVTLVDIIHPTQIRKKIQKYSNVHLVEKDITGGVAYQIFQKIQHYKKTKEIPMLTAYKAEPIDFGDKPGFIISCNTLTQPGIIIKEYIRNFTEIPETSILDLEKRIQEDQLNLLPPGKSCLITEYEEEIYGKNNDFIGTNPLLLISLPAEKNQRKWQWKFDKKFYYREDAQTFMNVIAINF